MAVGLCFLPGLAAQTGKTTGCADCHKEQVDQFSQSVHSRLASFELQGRVSGCESCHGPSAKHLESGEAKDIQRFHADSAVGAEKICIGCHADRVGMNWRHSEHAMNGITCIQCHKIHQSRTAQAPERGLLEKPMVAGFRAAAPPPKGSLAKPEAVLCGDCHKDVMAKMILPSRHPVREGKMTCSSCHNPHGSEVGSLKTAERFNDLCLNCHTSKQGPFVFDHQPVSEGCNTCHIPHGSVNNNLLKQNEPFICLQCHEAHFHIGRSGVSTPVSLPTGGSNNPFGESGFRRAFGTKCTQCHVSIHGSDLPGQSVAGRGKTLIR